MANIARAHLPTLKKTASYYVMHVAVAALVAYAVTGSLMMSLTLSLLEPTIQAVAFFFHEKAWDRIGRRNAAAAVPALAVATPQVASSSAA
ncbi:DUF2061 domain-containing protein [Ramlibacter tataouinensis]|uniref:DUF2061 domain-containing protein n=1 Tax=Ramlibacter tataouinensis TaxID=94132 RepID=UPI0002EBF400|nr:DUF2061 domain-containing protein [Ramlibacter tataouinensis]